ncbi:MAG TPA: MmgE/PrpD family protein [Mycobacteriales bacterium]|nr:MmgE/PrpD family protein [Mycobacteriales bacterium]
MGATERFADFAVHTRLEDVPATVTDAARLVVLDTIGVSLAALDVPIGRIVQDYAAAVGGDDGPHVLGTGIRAAAPIAAQANGTLAHGLDYDDHGHLSTHVLPAALAIGELRGSSGAELLAAYVLGRECGFRLSSIIEAKRKQKLGPTYRGWYRVGVVGPVAAAVAASRMLALDTGRTRHAIAIACSSSAGLRRNLGTMTKALHAGNGAYAGVTAALLAERGFTADAEAIEGELGLVGAICLPGEAEWEPLERLGDPYELAQKIGVKNFPACSPSHVPAEIVLRLREKHGVDPAEVVAVEADLHQFSLRRPDPQEAIATGYSLPYLLAIALVDGALGLDQVDGTRLHDPAVRALMARVTHDPQAAPAGRPERVTIRLADGTVLVEEADGKPDLRTAGPIIAKFADCASRRLDAEGVARLRDAVLESTVDVRSLLELTRSPREAAPC